ncbi:MAG: glycine--tRNA ligase [Candidatus Syntropharchaeia archaeon]
MDLYEKVIELARRRGFLWPSFEIYGGTAGFYDYGPLGAMLKRRIENLWRDFYVIGEGFYEIETPTIAPEEVFIASGHVKGFVDPLVECEDCKGVFRADDVGNRCPDCGGRFGEARSFNLMFKTEIGPGSKRKGYLRPETAQGMFINFQRLCRFYRDRLPFGVVQIGKAYRNEISPRQGVIRLREFTQAEAEIFVHPEEKSHPKFETVKDTTLKLYSIEAQENGEIEEIKLGDAVDIGIIAHEYLGYHIAKIQSFLIEVGISSEKMRFRQHLPDEMAHYASDCWDCEILTERFGWIECVGIADRTDYDLKSHEEQSQTNMSIYVPYDEPEIVERIAVKVNMGIIGPRFKKKTKKVIELLEQLGKEDLEKDPIVIQMDGKKIEIEKDLVEYKVIREEIKGENVIPHVIEPSYGIDRIIYGLLEHSFYEEKVGGETRTVLRFPKKIAPIQVAVLPLVTKDGLKEKAMEISSMLRRNGFMVSYDDAGTIGRRYRRQDEIGTPFCVTIDYDTLKKGTVTIRERDTMEQVRVNIKKIEEVIN